MTFGGLLGAFHAGVEYNWWEGVTACSTTAKAGGDPLAGDEPGADHFGGGGEGALVSVADDAHGTGSG